jgi:hypothetical protein
MLVHYATSHFMEIRSLFVVMSVTIEYITCVCNWVRPIRLHLPRRVSLLSSVTHVPKRSAPAVNKAPAKSPGTLSYDEARVALHPTRTVDI